MRGEVPAGAAKSATPIMADPTPETMNDAVATTGLALETIECELQTGSFELQTLSVFRPMKFGKGAVTAEEIAGWVTPTPWQQAVPCLDYPIVVQPRNCAGDTFMSWTSGRPYAV